MLNWGNGIVCVVCAQIRSDKPLHLPIKQAETYSTTIINAAAMGTTISW